MSDDERAFWAAFEQAKQEVEKWPSWKQSEVVDIYSESTQLSFSPSDELVDSEE